MVSRELMAGPFVWTARSTPGSTKRNGSLLEQLRMTIRLMPNNARSMARTVGFLWCIAAALTFSVPAPGQESAPPTAQDAGAAPLKETAETDKPPVSPVPVAEIAAQSIEVSVFLRSLDRELEEVGAEIDRITKEFSSAGAQPSAALAVTLAALERDQHIWQLRQKRARAWMDALTERARKLQNSSDRLVALHTAWAATREKAHADQEPASILHDVGRTLAAIEVAQAPFQERRLSLLTLQSTIIGELEECGNALDRITSMREKSVAAALHPDSPAIWNPTLWQRPWYEVKADLGAIREISFVTLVEYAWSPRGGMRVDVVLLVVFACIMLAARHSARHWRHKGAFESSVARVFEHPYAAALTLALLYRTSPYSEVPGMGRGLLQVLAIVPAILIVRPSLPPRVAGVLWVLGGLFAFDAFRQAVAGVPPIGQAILMFEALAGLASSALLARSLSAREGEAVFRGMWVLRLTVKLAFLTFLASLAAGALGYQLLARLTASGFLSAGILVAMLYASLLVLSGTVALALHTWPLRTLMLVRNHRDLLLRRTFHLLTFLAVVATVIRSLDYLGLLIPFSDFLGHLLGMRFERGAVSVTPGDILAFFATLYASHLVSVFLRFVLNEEVYPRTRITAGTSYAASYLLHYVILAVGFVVALGIMGVDFTRVTVLAGAFSVGLGFGLQNVVHNFVSGLILLFERPVHVGDAIETATIQGEVRRIGIRASVVRTWQGAEVMVPNSQLVSEKVTNWTLSDRKRRIDLPLGINYGANPALVVDLVESAARANPDVLDTPPPTCFMVGYGDSSVNFELRAWTDHFDSWYRVRSDLALAIYAAVQAAPGIGFPFPQRELRVLHDSGSTGNVGPTRPPEALLDGGWRTAGSTERRDDA